MRVASGYSGRPDSPPASFAVAWSRRLGGRPIVVLPTIMPSILRARATPTMSSRSESDRSGAILSSTGVGPARGATRSRASTTRASRSSSADACCRSRRPGVFGDEMLTVT